MSQSGVISNPNSSTNPLIANGEFIGTAEIVAQYAGLYYAIECSTNATLALEFSQDSGNWSQVQVLNVSANVLKEGLITIKNRYFRSRVVNITGDAQTFLRLSIIYKQVIPTEVNIDTTGLATEETAQSQLTDLGLISGCVSDNKLAVSGTVSVDTTGLASETTALQSLSNVSALRTFVETSFTFSPDHNLWVQVDTSEIPVDVEVSNQITGFSLETTQQDILNTVSNPPTATLILDSPEGISAYADSVPVPTVDAYKRPGWSYTNTSAGNKFNYYFYSNGNTTQTLADITGAWCICENDSTTTTSSIVNPIISIYTVGSLNVWYQSNRVYAGNTNMVAGMKYLCYWGIEPSIYPELPRIQLTLARQTGTLLPGETVLTMSVGSDSGAGAGIVKNLMTHIGWRNSSNEFITELIGDADFISTDVRILDKLSTGIAVTGSVSVSNFPASQTVSVSNFPATQPISGSVSVSNLPATQPVSGSVSVSNFPATQAVSVATLPSIQINNFPATQPVSGSVSVSNLPATQAVSGSVSVSNLPATQPVSGSVSVSNFPATQAVSVATLPSVEINNFSTSGLAKEITLGSLYTTTSGMASTTTTIGTNTGLLADCVNNGIYNLGVKIRESSALVQVSNVGFDNLSNINIPISYINSNLALTNGNLSILSGGVANNKFQCNVSIADGQKVIIDGGSVNILSLPSVEISGLVEVSNIGFTNLSNIDFPMSYINSNVSGLSSCVSQSNLNVRIFGSSDGTAWHHVKTNASGVVHTHLETVASGALTATVASGNYNALDVSVKNSSLPINSVNSGSWGNAVNNGSLNGNQYTSGIDISSSAIIYVIYRDGSTGVFDSILVEWSFDNTNWYYLGDSIAPSAPMGQSYRQGTLNDKRKYAFNYIRFKNNGNSSLSSVYITILGSSV
jgi:hypothetical protein